ncbi:MULTISPECIES: hypothetical protein [unclassified Rhizobium]|uniref:hypothetical protein n=1 Tax=unclassified Rhizobium TaxID=2613769 RepID=UPI001AE49A87|nr:MULTISPECIES: hypothetical protein [unclassified Rhizobium]MBP2461425.1 hypothetical protein [Rhizobium sp. PvP014]MBP2528821.1 hypothetical protein [Rhizobium sp. PvP099]
MPLLAAEELSDGQANLDKLIAELGTALPDWNEAETRFQIIDRLIVECFGWPSDPSQFRLETPHGGEYSDYELGSPKVAIWEAKRVGSVFELPAKRQKSLIYSLASLMKVSELCNSAIGQVNSYCLSRGVKIAVATNGHQIIAFIAEADLSSTSKSKCIVFESLSNLRVSFPRAWQLLSPGGLRTGSLIELLSRSVTPKPPEKLSAVIPSYPQYREPSDLQRSMIDIAELLLLSVEEQEELEQQFYEECYCESGALGQHGLISRHMLASRYDSLFPDAPDASAAQPVSKKGGKPQLTPEILAEAISSRPIALVGDVGVGKSSFLKHLMYVSAYSEFQHAIYAYVNLGRKGALSSSVRELVLDQIEEALERKYDIDVGSNNFVRSVYKKDIKRFEKSIWGAEQSANPEKYNDKLLEMLSSKQLNRAEHLRLAVEYLSKEKRKQIIIALDNADQRSPAVQQEAFVIAQNLAADWRATVFVSVRPKTFFLSKRSGTLAAYPHRVFTIAPPRVDEAVEKRLVFALSIAEGRVELSQLKNISLRLKNIATLIKVFLGSIDRSDAIKIFLENITAGNVRELIHFVAQMFGNPNVDLYSAVLALEESGDYLIPVHDFWKVALQGDNQYYHPDRAAAANMFDVSTDDAKEHFLMPLLLGMLDENSPRRNAEGFVLVSVVIEELQSFGFLPSSIEAAVRRANNKKLIEAPDRVTFEEDEDGVYGFVPEFFRITTFGAYHLKIWVGTFNYLDAMCVDTPIFNEFVADDIKIMIRSHSLADRYAKSVKFRDYLSQIWVGMNVSPSYFDWEAACQIGQETFDRVAKNLSRRGINRA